MPPQIGYEAVAFESVDANGCPVYHTNVMMWIGTRGAAVCFDSVVGEKVKAHL
jgi:hypothetical protein